jgi:small subunit ribosomal protein S20
LSKKEVVLPKGTSAEQAARAAERRRLRNKSVKSAAATHAIQAGKLIGDNKLEPAQKAVSVAISALDKAVKRGVIHRNTAARRKSRLMKKFNQAKLSGTSAPKKRTRTKKPTAAKQQL